MLTLMTSAPFKVENVATEGFDLTDDSQKIKASVLYSYEEFKTMKEEDIVGMMSTATEIFASYYTDICQNYYPAADEMPEEDPFAAALGSKLKYRPAREVPGPQIIADHRVRDQGAAGLRRAFRAGRRGSGKYREQL